MTDVTPPLDDFLREFEADSNTWWRIDCGHHLNLFEAAVERMQQAERLLSRLIVPSEVFVVPETSGGVYDPDLQEARIHQVLSPEELEE